MAQFGVFGSEVIAFGALRTYLEHLCLRRQLRGECRDLIEMPRAKFVLDPFRRNLVPISAANWDRSGFLGANFG